MEIILSILLFLIGAFIIWYSAEKFVHGAVGVSILFGISTFTIGVIFSGFEPENFSAGIAGALKGLSGVAMGTVIGSAIFLITLVVGTTAFLYPFKTNINKKYIWLTFISIFPLLLVMADGIISRIDGIILLALFIPTMIYIYYSSKKEIFTTSHEIEEVLEKRHSKRFYIFVLIASLIGMAIGAEILSRSAKSIVDYLNIPNTIFGMIFVAFAVSFEEFGRTLIPTKMKHPELAVGNIFGTVINLFLLNVGVIAMITPITIEKAILTLYFPFLAVSLLFVSIFASRGKLGKIEGYTLIGMYLLFLVLNFI